MPYFGKSTYGASHLQVGELAQWLHALAALVENFDSVLSIHMATQSFVIPTRGSDTLCWSLQPPGTHDAWMYMQAKPLVHIKQ